MPVIQPPLNAAQNYYGNIANDIPSKVFNKWRKALQNTRDGVSNCRVLNVGDSTDSGTGSTLAATFPTAGAWPTRLATLMNTTATPTIISLGVCPSTFSGGADNRWTFGTGWTRGNFGAANGATAGANAAAGSLVYTANPQVTCDGFYVYWIGNSGWGNLSCTATGGSATPINCNVAVGTYRTLVTAGSASATNTMTITTSGGQVYVAGVEPVLSTKSQVLIGNAGVGSATTANWATNTTYQGVGFINTVAPDLTTISLGINDAFAAVTPATYAANIQTLITAGQVTGDVLLLDFPPNNNSGALSYQQQYVPILQSLAASNNCAYLSIFNRFGSAYNTNFMNGDGTHCINTGYWDWAAFVANVIANP